MRRSVSSSEAALPPYLSFYVIVMMVQLSTRVFDRKYKGKCRPLAIIVVIGIILSVL